LLGAVRVRDGLRGAGIADDDTETRLPVQPPARPDGQLLTVTAPPGPHTADGDGLDIKTHEVEVERGEIPPRTRRDRHGTGETAAARLVGEAQGIVDDVVALVAGPRKERTTRARPTRPVRTGPRTASARRRRHHEQNGGDSAEAGAEAEEAHRAILR